METTKAILAELVKTLSANYEVQIDQFPAMKKPVRNALLAGYKDGVAAGVRHTVAMLGVTVKE